MRMGQCYSQRKWPAIITSLILVTKILPDSLYQIQAVEKQINSSGEIAYPVRLQMETVTKLNKMLKRRLSGL